MTDFPAIKALLEFINPDDLDSVLPVRPGVPLGSEELIAQARAEYEQMAQLRAMRNDALRVWTLSRKHPFTTTFDGPTLAIGETVDVVEVPSKAPALCADPCCVHTSPHWHDENEVPHFQHDFRDYTNEPDEERLAAGWERCACWYHGGKRLGWSNDDCCSLHPEDGPRTDGEIWE